MSHSEDLLVVNSTFFHCAVSQCGRDACHGESVGDHCYKRAYGLVAYQAARCDCVGKSLSFVTFRLGPKTLNMAAFVRTLARVGTITRVGTRQVSFMSVVCSSLPLFSSQSSSEYCLVRYCSGYLWSRVIALYQ